MGIGSLILIVIIVVVAFMFWSEISSFINDTASAYKTSERNERVSIEKPKAGQTVCDLFITVEVRSISALSGTTIIGTERILFTDGKEGKLITYSWDNCHEYSGFNFLSLSIIDYFTESEFIKLEFFIPAEDLFDQKVILTYILVDNRSGLEKKLPLYENFEYIHPQFVGTFDFEQRLKFYDILPVSYTLEIIPDEAHFENLKLGQAYKKIINAPT